MADDPRAPWAPPHVADLAEVRDALSGGPMSPDGAIAPSSIPFV